jgi:hypothetical protein
MTASIRHLRLVPPLGADVIPLPRAAAKYGPLAHHVLRLIPQEAVTRRGGHITVTGRTADAVVRAGLAAAERDGLIEWMHTGSPRQDIARLTEAGIAALAEWNRTHGQQAHIDTEPDGAA